MLIDSVFLLQHFEDMKILIGVMSMVTAGFMVGVALGQKIVGMGKGRRGQAASTAQRLQSAKLAAYRRMKARQNTMISSQRTTYGEKQAATTVEQIVFEEGFAREFRKEFKDDASGQLLNSIRKSFSEFNAWVKRQTNGLLDLNMSLAIFFIIRGLRRIILEKQYPNAWQMIWWASSILRGWRFV